MEGRRDDHCHEQGERRHRDLQGKSRSRRAPPRAAGREWLALAVLALPTLQVSLDLFVVLLTLPSLSAASGATQQLWILDVYALLVRCARLGGSRSGLSAWVARRLRRGEDVSQPGHG
jgi:hypothetical protein